MSPKSRKCRFDKYEKLNHFPCSWEDYNENGFDLKHDVVKFSLSS